MPADPEDTLDAQPAELSGFAGETTGQAVGRAGAWNAFSHFVPQIYLLVQSVAAARFLGPDDMGRQSFVAWAAVSLVFVWSRGLPDAVLRFAAETLGRERPGDVRGLVRWATRAQLAVGLTGFALVASLGLLRGELRAAWVLAGVVTAMNVMRGIPLAVLRALLRWRESSLIGVFTGAVAMAATVAVLAAGGGIAGMFAVEAAVGVGATLYVRHRALRVLDGLPAPVTVDHELHHQVSRYALVSSAQAVFAYVVWQRSEFLLLDRYSADSELALYSVAFGGVAVLTRVIQGFAAVVPGSIATLHGAGATDRIKGGYARGVRLLMLLTLPITAISAALGPAAIRVVYGSDYAGAGRVLLAIVAAVPVVALFHLAFGLAQGLGRLRVIVLASVVGTVADLAVGFALVPRHGAFGAAIANAAAQTAASLVVVGYATRYARGAAYALPRLLALALAAAVAGGAAWVVVEALPDVPGIVLGGLAGVAVYGGAAFVLVTPDDRRWLRRLAR